MGDPDDFYHAWECIFSAFVGDDLDEYAKDFVETQLKRAGIEPDDAGDLDHDDVMAQLCALTYTDRQTSWIYETETRIEDAEYRDHMTTKDD